MIIRCRVTSGKETRYAELYFLQTYGIARSQWQADAKLLTWFIGWLPMAQHLASQRMGASKKNIFVQTKFI